MLETRPFDNDISIETITKLCAIQNVDVDTVPKASAQTKKQNRMMPYYVCRYKLVRSSYVRYQLVPVLGEIRVDKTTTTSTSKQSATKRKLVSPIKITRNGVERITRSGSKESIASDIENVSPNKHKRIAEIVDSPRVARRNLNDSFGTDGAATPDVLNYSIVAKTPTTNDLNICLRVSQRQKFANPKYDPVVLVTPHKTPEKAAKKSPVTDTVQQVSTPTTSRLRTRRASMAVAEVPAESPSTRKVSTRRSSVTCTTPSTTAAAAAPLMHPRRSILKTPSKGGAETPTKKRLTLSAVVEEMNQAGEVTRTPTRNSKKNKTGGYYLEDIPATPPSEEKTQKKSSSGRTPKKAMTPSSSKLKQLRSGEITPSITARSQPVNRRRSQLELARESLHVSALLKSLPCRETEFENVFHFVEGKLLDKCGGCMYISGELRGRKSHLTFVETKVTPFS